MAPLPIWSNAAVEQLQALWASGLSASQIADEISDATFRPTRSAVIGKVHRLGLSGRVARICMPRPRLTEEERAASAARSRKRRNERQRAYYAAKRARQPPPMAAEPLPIEPDAPAPDARPCSLLELTAETCRFPHGDPGTATLYFCGAPPTNGPYCLHHHRLTHFNIAG